jgi:hypothetical protein
MPHKKQLPKTKNDKCKRACCVSIWDIFQPGTIKSISWIDHSPNPRFAINDPRRDSDTNNPSTLSDDIVVDKETGLIWARDANLLGYKNWLDANTECRGLELANRMGWRLPSVEELSSLVDPGQSNLALPAGNPFVNVQYGAGVYAYWTSTNTENPIGAAWFVNMWRGAGQQLSGLAMKTLPGYIWPVRGGIGGNNWNW